MKNNKFFASLLLVSIISLSSCSLSDLIRKNKQNSNSDQADSEDTTEIVAPTFEKSEGIRFTAYSGPTFANLASGNSNINTVTDEHVKKVAEAGFNRILALYEGGMGGGGSDVWKVIKNRAKRANEDAMKMLPLCEKYNLEYYVRDWSFYGLLTNYPGQIVTEEDYKKAIDIIFDDDCEYIHHPNYCGSFATDEPFYNDLEKVEWQVRLYNDALARKGIKAEPLVNLLPNYVSTAGLGSTYQHYVDKYFETIAPQVGYVSYDYYPLMSNYFAGGYVKNTYLANLLMMAKKCKETGIELRTFMQSIGNWTGMRQMKGIADFRFQIFTNLAFGSKEVTYYEYGNPYSFDSGDYALLNLQDGTYNWTYEAAKKANWEAHAIEDAYLQYDWDGVMYKNGDDEEPNVSFTYLDNDKLESHPRVAIKKVTADTLLTTFKHKESKDDAFMLVNEANPLNETNDDVTLHFKDAKGLLMYRLGQKVIVKLPKSGDYTFKLYPGEGRFIIPIK